MPVDPELRISEVWCYPVKSMSGGPVEEAHVSRRGMVGDRGYAVIDRADGRVASAKRPRRWGPLLTLDAAYVDQPVPGGALPPVTVTFPDGSVIRSDGVGADAALSRFVGRDVTLSATVPAAARFEEVWPAIEGLAPAEFIDATASGTEGGETVSSIDLASAAPGTFFDVAPLHVLTAATLAELARLVPGSGFDRRRYRPNLLLDGPATGFVERGWTGQVLRAGTVEMPVLLPTMRCVMTTLAQPGLAEDRETLRGIARHNRIEIPGLGTWACAGVYAGVQAEGVVRVGDAVAVG